MLMPEVTFIEVRPCRWLSFLLVLLGLTVHMPTALHANTYFAVIDKSVAVKADLDQIQLDAIAQAVRGEARKQLPADFLVLSEENTISILLNMGMSLADCDGECEIEIARNLNADWLISINVVRFGSEWSILINLFKTDSAELVDSHNVTTKREEGLIEAATDAAAILCFRAFKPSAQGQEGQFGSAGTAFEMQQMLGHVVSFDTKPTGATVYLDDSFIGETPFKREIKAGPHRIRFSLQRYEDWVEDVTVRRDMTMSYSLVPLFAVVNISSTPSGLPVFLDGERVGLSPLLDHVLGHGSHTVKIGDSLVSYPVGERFTLAKGGRKSVHLDVVMKMGGLVVRNVDQMGNLLETPVFVDGINKGNTPLQLQLYVGEHIVVVGDKTRRVQIREKQVETIKFTGELSKESPRQKPQLPVVAVESPPEKTKSDLALSLGMHFVSIPGGSFNFLGAFVVRLSPFQMMSTEVTQRQWREIMGAEPSFFYGDNRPVEWISWDDVSNFIRLLNERDPGKGYRLPTEAEWEYACRAGSSQTWCFGDEALTLEDYAWFSYNSYAQTHDVASKRPNKWGLYDMHGNVWEWCQDWFDDEYSATSKNPAGPESGVLRVTRGGGWGDSEELTGSSQRMASAPGSSYDNLGFRLVRNQ